MFLARRRSGSGIEKRLVIKRIRSERAADPRLLTLFVREARVSMALSHQNIVPVFDFGRADNSVFLAMEHVEGRDFGAVLARARERGLAMDPTLIAFVGAECCAALAYAHGRRFDDTATGVIHRDVTPRNILVSWSGEVRLTDFGVAILQGDDRSTIRGTPSYMAPEQARGEPIDGRADLYGLGLVLWEAASGGRARGGDASAALSAARTGVVPPLPTEFGSLADVVARATAPTPADRFADSRAMQDALDRIARAPGGAPSRRLAEWLSTLFDEGDRSDPVPAVSTPLDAVTFLDDGEQALLGDATALSMAGTAAEVEPPPPPHVRGEPSPEPPPAGSNRRTGAVLVATIAVVASAGLALFRSQRPLVLEAANPDDSTVPLAVYDAGATGPIDASRPMDAQLPPPKTAAVPTTPPKLPRGRPRREVVAQVAPRMRRVTIGARPWATFYVDGEVVVHETPETLELPPGPHRVRFVNVQAGVERTITIEVPGDRDVRHVEDLGGPDSR